ncbi:uncharacterized protein LOC117785081 isoform X3 [Drosophila innubila]|uniref:uncharacterized protein LOC117785081 isoform X3 n=1 Tax=Drosophila innubila TaxID=198719 RepID=UPI00148D53E5|nr:uncharacterized protein LOC117785081 isoform X3 [Drosophila innubila]
MEVNYKFTCRCCLKSEAEFFKLDSLSDSVLDDNDECSTKIPLIRLLLFCMRTENLPELPQYICVECSKSLQISYFFIQNSLRAHEILCRKLCPGKLEGTTRFNGQQLCEERQDDATVVTQKTKAPKSGLRHECKVCGAIIYNRVELKQHIRMHTEAGHACKLCKFVTFKQRQLPEHYQNVHGLTAAQIEKQLKIRRSMQAAAAATTSAATSTSAVDDNQVKVCTLEDMELLIPTVMRPEDFSQPQLDADQLRDIEQQLANSLAAGQSGSDAMPTEPTIATCGSGSSNMSIGAQFLVMPDGSLQQVNDGGVVFEYIDDSKSTSTTKTTLQSLLDDSKPDVSYNAMDIDVNHLVPNALPQITVKPPPRPGPGSIAALKHKCKLCPKAFPTVARLKSHQLTHSHLPKFYCDQCAYYSLRSADLIQHYMEEHKTFIGDNKSQLEKSSLSLTTDRSRIYSCDMCLYETLTSFQLRKHYSDKHQMQPSEVQLRPSWSNESKEKGGRSTLVSDQNQLRNSQPAISHIPLGIKYPTVSAVTTAELRATNESSATTAMQLNTAQPTTTTTAVVTPAGDINVVVDATTLFYAATAASTTVEATATTTTTPPITTDSNEFTIFPGQSFVNSMTTTTMPGETSGMLPAVNTVTVSAVAPTGNPNSSIFGDMQDFIDDTDVAAVCTIPADDMPVVDGDDIVIDNNNMNLDFDAENLFEDFEEDAEVGEEDDDDDEEDAENDDENDNNNAAADQNLFLTSDDDDVDDFDDEQSKHLQKPYCIYCNKKFTSQYKFENHMFVHRGLAPYRCELCTNLYNMKRLLIRHYKTVHKRMPTRDMVQAKGDKVLVERTAIEKLNINVEKLAPMLMCAKCPFECEQEAEMRKHLNAHHGINDGVSVHANEVFIIRKLPFECPRCIRSFAAKRTLTRHLQRSHLVDTIIEMQAPQLTTSTAATTTTSTATTTLPKNDSDVCGDNKATTMQQESNFMDTLDDDGNEKCEDSMINSDTGIETDNEDICTKPLTTTSAIGTVKTALNEDNATDTNTEEATSAEVASSTRSESSTPLTTSETADKAPTVDSTLFPPPTPFDFDLDFIGNDSHATSLKNNNDSFSVISSVRQLLNGSDKLLTAALEPSPVKDLRPRLPRTPIYVCKQCNQTFDELGKLLQHEMDQHSSGTVSARRIYQHQCNICSSSYRTVTLLNYHMKRHAPRKVQCEQCPKEFTSNSEMEEHVGSEHVESKQVKLEHVKSEQLELGNVKSEHAKKIDLKCGIDGCTKTFNYKHHLKRHQTASHTPVQYICPKCGRDMLTSLKLRHHMYIHKSTHSYKCPKCVRTYIRGNSFRRHALREHKWDPTDGEMANIYCVNETPPSMQYSIRELRSVNVENEQSD